jgi:Tol biopolymer transport system component
MPNIADLLERESRTVDLEQGDFERLLDRRDRKQRNRRIQAGAVGVIVALAVGILLARSLTSHRIPADRPEPRPAPAASGSLAYALDGDIYVADPAGSNPVKIADGRSDQDCTGRSAGRSYWAEGPMWSPDGRYLAYRYTDCSEPFVPGLFPRGVVISDAEGNVLAAFPAQGWDIAWSPDSTRVAVWDAFFENGFKIGVYGPDGVRQTQLTMPSGWTPSGDRDPVWMPDGTSLTVDDLELPLDGGTPRQLRWGAEAYSPDGSHVAYADHRSLTVAQSDGSEPREVSGKWAFIDNVTWSPTGDLIAFTTSDRDPAGWSAELRVIDVASGSPTLLLEGEHDTSLEVIGFSPRGDRILFARAEDRQRGEESLWSIGVDRSDPQLVVAGTLVGEWLAR